MRWCTGSQYDAQACVLNQQREIILGNSPEEDEPVDIVDKFHWATVEGVGQEGSHSQIQRPRIRESQEYFFEVIEWRYIISTYYYPIR